MIFLKSAWLITWEWDGDAAAKIDAIVAVVNYRYSTNHIKKMVQFLFDKETSNLMELVGFSKNPKDNPYRAEVTFNSEVLCGKNLNPYMYARLVKNLEVWRNSGEAECIKWTEYPQTVPDVSSRSGTREMRGSVIRTVIRKKTGVLSSLSAWDPMKGRLKTSQEINTVD